MNLKEEMLQIVSEATHSQYSARIVDYIITKPVFQGTQFRDSAKIPKTSTYNLLSNLVTKKMLLTIVLNLKDSKQNRMVWVLLQQPSKRIKCVRQN